MNPLRRQIGERLEHEAPLVHARMGNDQLLLVDAAVAEEQEIEIQRPRLTASSASDPALLLLDLEQPQEEGSWLELRLDLGDRVQVGALGRRPDRIGLVDRRDTEPVNAASGAERFERAPQVALPVAQVRAERDEGAAHPGGSATGAESHAAREREPTRAIWAIRAILAYGAEARRGTSRGLRRRTFLAHPGEGF